MVQVVAHDILYPEIPELPNLLLLSRILFTLAFALLGIFNNLEVIRGLPPALPLLYLVNGLLELLNFGL